MSPLIHIFQNNRQEGPYTVEQVEGMVESGAIAPFTLCWMEGMAEWAPLNVALRISLVEDLASASLSSPLPSGPLPTAVPPVQPSTAPGPRGIGGWLLFFCVGLTILGPLWTLSSMVTGWEGAQAIFPQFPSLKTAMMWENFGCAVLLIYGFAVGCIVWSGSPKGRDIAKRYMLIQLFGFFGVELIAVLLIRDIPSQMLAAVLAAAFGASFRPVLSFVIWWFYFKKSKRVRNTYGDEL